MGRKMTSLRGQLGTRSSALSPTSSKLTTQYLVLDHMNNHYKKIVNAKSAIDNKPPKSLKTSQKVRDRQLRHVKETGSRPGSRVSMRPHSQMQYYDEDNIVYNDNLWDEFDPDDEDDLLIRDIVKSTLKQHGQGSAIATYGSSSQNEHVLENTMGFPGRQHSMYQNRHDNRPSSAHSSRLINSAGSRTNHVAVPIPPHKDKTYDGDVLLKNAHMFTEPEKPFTPRLLKSNRSSRLSQYKFYTAPKRENKVNPETKVKNDSKYQEEKKSVPPVPKPRMKTLQSKAGDISPDKTDAALWDTTLMMETLQSRDFSKYENKDNLVPRLDISLDQDHMNWLHDQASKAHHRAKSGGLKTTDEYIELGNTMESTDKSGLRLGREMYIPRSSRLIDEEEELKYLQFVKDVTNDVLNRGIYTNRVLKQIFEGHIQNNKGKLRETRMRLMLNKVRRDLGIPKEDLCLDTTHKFDMTEVGISSKISISKLSEITESPFTVGKSSIDSYTCELGTASSQDTYGLKSTGAMFSTIHSNVNDEMSDTQALKKYEHDITVKETLADDEYAIDRRDKERHVDDSSLSVGKESLLGQFSSKAGLQNTTGEEINQSDTVNRTQVSSKSIPIVTEKKGHRDDSHLSQVSKTSSKKIPSVSERPSVNTTQVSSESIPIVTEKKGDRDDFHLAQVSKTSSKKIPSVSERPSVKQFDIKSKVKNGASFDESEKPVVTQTTFPDPESDALKPQIKPWHIRHATNLPEKSLQENVKPSLGQQEVEQLSNTTTEQSDTHTDEDDSDENAEYEDDYEASGDDDDTEDDKTVSDDDF